MALQFIDGFDHYYLTNDPGFTGGAAATAQKWDSGVLNGELYPKLAAGRFGAGSAMKIEANGGQGHIQKNVPTPKDEMIVGFAFLPSPSRSDLTVIRFNLSTGQDVEMRLNMSGNSIAVVSSGGGVNAITSSVLTNGVWQYLEFRVKVHATLGEVEVRLDETVIHNLSAKNSGDTGATITSLLVQSNNNAQADYIDDLYLLDTTGGVNDDFLGDVRVDVLYPDANGTNNDFTLFTDGTQTYDPITSNYEAVQNQGNALIGRDHNYVESGLVGASEDYDNHSLADISVTPSTIFGVQVVNNAKKTDTGTVRYKDEMIISGTAYDDGSEVTAVSGDYSMSTFIRDTDPSDNAAWTIAKVDAVGSGFTITHREI